MSIIWAACLVLLLIVEASTAQLVTIWFAVGALAGLVASIFGASIWVQVVLALVVSLVALIVTRPLVKKLHSKKFQPTNADRIIGKTAIVEEDIINDEGKGLVKVGGIAWTARSSNGAFIPSGTAVTVEKIDGVKLMVSVQKQTATV